ncbi:MAG TPA: HAMP domain-containing protein [Sediminispirochaeta sp.]|nr:HAMP domain-containing protein [Sediminispirochaeta sp.]
MLFVTIQFFLLSVFGLSAQELYWEDPRIVIPDGARFPQTAYKDELSLVLWHEYEYQGGEATRTSVSLMWSRGDQEWSIHRGIIGPYQFSGSEVPYASISISDEGEIFIAAAASGQRIEIFSYETGDDEARRIGSLGAEGTEGISLAPRLSHTADGGMIVFATHTLGVESEQEAILTGSLGVNYAVSRNGRSWTPLRPLLSQSDIAWVYLPSHSTYQGRDYVVFQGSPRDSRYYQLFLVSSDDGGRSWGAARRITDFSDSLGGEGGDPNNFDNQRPFLSTGDDGLLLTWERKFANVTSPQIYYGSLGTDGLFRDSAERVSSGNYVCRSPRIAQLDGKTYLTWYDNRKGVNRVFVAYRQGLSWQDEDISVMTGENRNGQLVPAAGKLNAVWENSSNGRYRLVLLEPDQTVDPPVLNAVDFRRNDRNARDRYTITWSVPEDSSGIAGFNYLLDRDPEGRPAENMRLLRRDARRAEVEVKRDGWWYFHVIARDYAGNWSDTSSLRFYRDTTPPEAVEFEAPERDEEGYLSSNSTTLRWEAPEAEDLEGYTYRLQYLASESYEGDFEDFDILDPPDRILSREPNYSFSNIDNGTWAFTVAPVDGVGNVGPTKTLYFQLNKYIPVTYVTRVQVEQDQLNRYQLRIIGRGFSEGGEIQEIILDRDGEPPYDYSFSQGSDLYTVDNDRLITGPFIDQIDQGEYRIGLVHPRRGTYFTAYTLQFESTGVVKFGDFTLISGPEQPLRGEEKIILLGGDLQLLLLMILLTAMMMFAVWKISQIVRETFKLRRDVRALIESRQLPYEVREEKLEAMRKRGIGLRVKFALLTTFLVLIIVLMVAVPLGNYLIETQRKNLTEGLQESTRVLIESITSGAEKFLPEENSIELGRLPRQMSAAEDARFITITGPGSSSTGGIDPDFFDYLWATNDPLIEEKVRQEDQQEGIEQIQTGDFSYERGTIKVEDAISPRIPSLVEKINGRAEERVGEMVTNLEELQQEARQAAGSLASRQDQDTAQLLTELQDEISRLSSLIEDELATLSDQVYSEPEFKTGQILTGPREYVFYRPIVYQDSSRQGVYYHGMVRLGISTDRIIREIISSRDTLIRRTVVIALVAIGLGIVGALILATIIIIPIKRLVRGIETIRDTEDKEKLKDHEINVKTRDEISILADTINQMTKGLVSAAAANKDLIVGKEIQKMFIPLEQNSRGRKLTTGALSLEGAEFFGYYEGAKGVSGDYFDYMELTPGKYGIIKCDVAGKGVAASLIMVEVATIFHSFFNAWVEEQKRKDELAARKGVKRVEEDPNIQELVYSINRLVQERGFSGRFAALTVLLFDSKDGKTVMCNAGDNLVHIFNGEKRKMEAKTLPEAPAAGVFPNDLVEMQSGFKRIPHVLRAGDMLLLFTDGLEEAQRHFRDENFEITTCQEKGLAEGELHDTHALGTDNEELGIPRIYDIVNTLVAGGTYRLFKYHNPIKDEELEFDFSSCQGTIEEVVIALMAVEKIFRMYPDPKADENDVVVMDKKVDAFLREHFKQYDLYFHHPLKVSEDQEEYLRYSHIKEDEQYDDLTLLGVKKKTDRGSE